MTQDILINDLQKRFNEEYAYLTLKFFRVFSQGERLSTVKRYCDPSKTLGQEILLKKTGTIAISDNMTVNELIEEFYNTYGVHVQVLRKSANLWMEITLTNNWTLRQQNNHAMEISVQ